MKWRVSKAGSGWEVYDSVRVIEGGALECTNQVSNGRWNNSVPRIVAYYGPGMWVSAVEEETARDVR